MLGCFVLGARREKIKAEALRKLTLEERKALGFA